MVIRSPKHLLLPLLALGVAFAMTASVPALAGSVLSLQLNLGSETHWSTVEGTRVEYLPEAEPPPYDVFRYGGMYYVYDNDTWYMSRQENGDFTQIDDRSVPSDMRRVPRDHWRNYPAAWESPTYQDAGGAPASLQITFDTRPHWTSIRGTSVEEIPLAERPAYDVFRYDGDYYAYDNDHWYISPRASGDFTMIDDRSVPSEFSRVPRGHWRNYPAAWQGRNDQSSGGASMYLEVDLGSRPHWTSVHGTRVEEISEAQRPGYDMFRLGGNYYVYNNDQWYMSRHDHGEYTAIDDRSVPSELSRVPRDHWRHYPAAWQNRYDQGPEGTSASMHVDFTSKPHWEGVHGLRVQEIQGEGRPSYDMFRYGSFYYIYNNNQWYRSHQWRGQFTAIDARSLPYEFSRVPRDHWRNYPADWVDENGNPRAGGYHTRHHSWDRGHRQMEDRNDH